MSTGGSNKPVIGAHRAKWVPEVVKSLEKLYKVKLTKEQVTTILGASKTADEALNKLIAQYKIKGNEEFKKVLKNCF
jgi:hypothetical protein